MKITNKEWTLVIVFTILGVFFSSKGILFFLESLNPFMGLIIYYGIITVTLLVLSYFELITLKKPKQILGALFIIFAFFVIFNWENPYVQYVTKGNLDQASNVFYGSEDGATWYLWSNITDSIDTIRVLTFIITPALLTLLGGL